jgi:hypothetical protein
LTSSPSVSTSVIDLTFSILGFLVFFLGITSAGVTSAFTSAFAFISASASACFFAIIASTSVLDIPLNSIGAPIIAP